MAKISVPFFISTGGIKSLIKYCNTKCETTEEIGIITFQSKYLPV